jgi:isoleucyl-tRNA synthetase
MKDNTFKLKNPDKQDDKAFYIVMTILIALIIISSPLLPLINNWVQNHIYSRYTNTGRRESATQEVTPTPNEKSQEVEKLDKENQRLSEIEKELEKNYLLLIELESLPQTEENLGYKNYLISNSEILTLEAMSYE